MIKENTERKFSRQNSVFETFRCRNYFGFSANFIDKISKNKCPFCFVTFEIASVLESYRKYSSSQFSAFTMSAGSKDC